MVRITDPGRSRAFYEALGFRFSREMDIVRDGELEATNGASLFRPYGQVAAAFGDHGSGF
jgi:hypothetical protein